MSIDNPGDLWDVALAEAVREKYDGRGPSGHDASHEFAAGAEWGAGWAFAIVGMFQAMQQTYCHYRHVPGAVCITCYPVAHWRANADAGWMRGYEHGLEDAGK